MAGEAQSLGVVASYDELLAICRRQVQELNFNYEMLDIAAGFNVGYASKLFAGSEHCASGGRRTKRYLSGASFDAYLAALGLELVVVQNPAKVAKVKAFCAGKLLKREGPARSVASDPPVSIRVTRNFLRRIGRLGGLARARKQDAIAARREQRSEIYRRNALKRWAIESTRGV